jgi:hypothetical protein
VREAAARAREGARNKALTVSQPSLRCSPSAAAKTRRCDPGPRRAGFQDVYWACPAGSGGEEGAGAPGLLRGWEPPSLGIRLA